ncbi:MAG TPA: ACT domain-containing protein [Thermoanaerobaculia bacterium]|nr:ACT domain-containing protein [Thermoanaerobaculia bacterium]
MRRFTLMPERFAVAKLDSDQDLPPWAGQGTFSSITRTEDEISIVCREDLVPDDILAERAWRCLRVEGPIPFFVTGVAASFATPLAAAGISIFIVSTYDTDYLFVKEGVLETAIEVLEEEGHTVNRREVTN